MTQPYDAIPTDLGDDRLTRAYGISTQSRRDKSTDHANGITRHLVDRGRFDGRGVRQTARLVWRALAMLQDELEAEEGFPRSRASKTSQPAAA